MKTGLLDARFKFVDIKNFVYMSDESVAARDSFIEKYNNQEIFEEQNCYICEERAFRVISEVDRYGFFYPTAICEKCGNVQQKDYYREDVLIDFYSNYYRKIYGCVGQSPREYFEAKKGGNGQAIYNFVTSVCKPQNVLEVGCSAGGTLSVFKDKGCEVLGLDFDDEYLEVARQNGVAVINGSLDKLNEDNKYDVIILSHVLEHIVSPIDFLKSIRERLQENGVLYIEVPTLNYVYEGGDEYGDSFYGFDLLNYWQNAHTIHFSTETLRLLCNQAGFQKIKGTNFNCSCWKLGVEDYSLSESEKKASFDNMSNLLLQIEKKRKSLKIVAIKHIKRSIKFVLGLLGLKSIARSLYYRLKRRERLQA